MRRIERSWFLRSVMDGTTYGVGAVFKDSHVIDYFDAEASIVGMTLATIV